MKKRICMIAIVALTIPALYADRGTVLPQDPPSGSDRWPNREEIESLKEAYMIRELGLTPEESQKFWPLYNQYWEERAQLGDKRRKVTRKIRETNAGDAEINEFIKYMKEEIDIYEKYIPRFKEIIPASKVAKMFTSEEGFKRQLLNQANERGGGREPR